MIHHGAAQLTAYGQWVQVNRGTLIDTMTLLERSMNELIGGAPELTLILGPSARIGARLGTKGRPWQELEPVV